MEYQAYNQSSLPTPTDLLVTMPLKSAGASEQSVYESDNAMIVMQDEHERRCWPLTRTKPFTIGRSEHCDITVNDRQISRYHARIVWSDGCYQIKDLGSKNGTTINGKSHPFALPLQDGDEFNIGIGHNLVFIDDGATAPLTLTPARRGIWIDQDTRSVWLDSAELNPPLSLPQYQLLLCLWENAGKVILRDQIVDTVWADESFEGISEQAIDALVRRLRERLAEVDPDTQYVITVRGHGFRLASPTD